MAQELFSVLESCQRSGLFFGRTGEDQADMRSAKIGRKMNLRDSDRTYPRIGHFVPDQLFQFFTNAFRDAFCAVRIQISEYRRWGKMRR